MDPMQIDQLLTRLETETARPSLGVQDLADGALRHADGLSDPLLGHAGLGQEFEEDGFPVHGHHISRLMKKVNSHLIELPNTLTTMHIGDRIRTIRKDLGWSQKELSRRSGVTQGLISQIENGTNQGTKYLAAIAAALDVNADWLATGKGSKKRTEQPSVMATNYGTPLVETLAAVPVPDGEGVLLVFRDENSVQVTIRLQDSAVDTLLERLAAVGRARK